MNIAGIRQTKGIEYHGNQGLILSRVGSLNTDSKGVDTCDAEWTIRKDRWTQLPRRGSPHPLWSHIAMNERRVSIDGAFAIARCSYEGVSSEETNKPEYELVLGVESSAIETHPDFDKRIGGKPTAGLNGAMWRRCDNDSDVRGGAFGNATEDANYVFWKFSNFIGNAKNPFAGIENYLDACSVVWRKTVMSKESLTELLKAGKIDRPEGPVPRLPGARNWLNMGTSQKRRGFSFEHTTEWKASGPKGWNRLIYGKAS